MTSRRTLPRRAHPVRPSSSRSNTTGSRPTSQKISKAADGPSLRPARRCAERIGADTARLCEERKGINMPYAAVIEVDNRGEDLDDGRRGLREELAPAMKALPGFNSGLFMTAYERGRGIAVVVFDTQEQAEQFARGLTIGQELRDGGAVTAADAL